MTDLLDRLKAWAGPPPQPNVLQIASCDMRLIREAIAAIEQRDDDLRVHRQALAIIGVIDFEVTTEDRDLSPSPKREAYEWVEKNGPLYTDRIKDLDAEIERLQARIEDMREHLWELTADDEWEPRQCSAPP